MGRFCEHCEELKKEKDMELVDHPTDQISIWVCSECLEKLELEHKEWEIEMMDYHNSLVLEGLRLFYG